MSHTVQTRSVLGSLALAAGLGFLALALAPAQDPSLEEPTSDVQLTREALEQLIEAKRLIAQEKLDWAEGRELMQDRIEVVRGSIDGLQQKIAAAETNIRETDEQASELGTKHDALEEAAAELATIATELEARLKALVPQLPAMLQERVQPLVVRFPSDSGDTKQSLGARFGTIGGILQEVDKFNLAVHPTSEMHTLADGTSANVGVVYLGLGAGYYSNSDGTQAGIGAPGPEGWTWTHVEDTAQIEQIHLAIQVARGDEGATYALVPASVR